MRTERAYTAFFRQVLELVSSLSMKLLSEKNFDTNVQELLAGNEVEYLSSRKTNIFSVLKKLFRILVQFGNKYLRSAHQYVKFRSLLIYLILYM